MVGIGKKINNFCNQHDNTHHHKAVFDHVSSRNRTQDHDKGDRFISCGIPDDQSIVLNTSTDNHTNTQSHSFTIRECRQFNSINDFQKQIQRTSEPEVQQF